MFRKSFHNGIQTDIQFGIFACLGNNVSKKFLIPIVRNVSGKVVYISKDPFTSRMAPSSSTLNILFWVSRNTSSSKTSALMSFPYHMETTSCLSIIDRKTMTIF